MLRLLVLLLVLANAAFAGWSAGLLAPYGFSPAPATEPQRLQQQIRPESLRIIGLPEPHALSVDAISGLVPVASLAAAPADCLQAGIFNEEQTAVLRARLQSVLPAGSWLLETAVEPARWIVYMGKYSSAEALEKKRGELRQLRVPYELLNNPVLEPGLSLGSFASEPEAEAELSRIAGRGVRSAKVIRSGVESRGQKLRLPAVSESLRTQLESLKPQLAGKALQACA